MRDKVIEFVGNELLKLGAKKIPTLQHVKDFGPFMAFVIERFKDKKEIKFLEVGILAGGSFKIIGETLQKFGHDVFGVAVDLPKADSKFGGTEVSDIPASLKSISPTFQYEMVVGNSRDPVVIEKVRTFAPFDLAFIDGDHTVMGHMADKNNYMPMVNGLMAFHDLAEPQHEVKKNWPNIREGHKYWEFTFTNHYGIGCLEVNEGK